MPEKSIILHAHEIRRLLDVGEAQIWRPVKNVEGDCIKLRDGSYFPLPTCDRIKQTHWNTIPTFCPFQPGERRWVKEKFQIYDICDGWDDGYEAYILPIVPKEKPEYPVGIKYAADSRSNESWRSATRLPRWAARLTVEILDVEARRVQDITEGEVRATGVLIPSPPRRGNCGRPESYRRAFIRDWDTRYPPRGPCFDENPWAWKLEVKKL